ncbi:hypothetical protein AB9K41_14195, partial [Cribrihabitans sp. XS_ASV171]
ARTARASGLISPGLWGMGDPRSKPVAASGVIMGWFAGEVECRTTVPGRAGRYEPYPTLRQAEPAAC